MLKIIGAVVLGCGFLMPQMKYVDDNTLELNKVIVGTWHYNISLSDVFFDFTILFTEDHDYRLIATFPRNPDIFGKQILLEAGRYEVDKNKVTTIPSRIKVMNSRDGDNNICNYKNDTCSEPELLTSKADLEVVDNDTLNGFTHGVDFQIKRIH